MDARYKVTPLPNAKLDYLTNAPVHDEQSTEFHAINIYSSGIPGASARDIANAMANPDVQNIPEFIIDNSGCYMLMPVWKAPDGTCHMANPTRKPTGKVNIMLCEPKEAMMIPEMIVSQYGVGGITTPYIVQRVQQELRAINMYYGVPDGIVTKDLTDAVGRAQHIFGMPVTGIININLIMRLRVRSISYLRVRPELMMDYIIELFDHLVTTCGDIMLGASGCHKIHMDCRSEAMLNHMTISHDDAYHTLNQYVSAYRNGDPVDYHKGHHANIIGVTDRDIDALHQCGIITDIDLWKSFNHGTETQIGASLVRALIRQASIVACMYNHHACVSAIRAAHIKLDTLVWITNAPVLCADVMVFIIKAAKCLDRDGSMLESTDDTYNNAISVLHSISILSDDDVEYYQSYRYEPAQTVVDVETYHGLFRQIAQILCTNHTVCAVSAMDSILQMGDPKYWLTLNLQTFTIDSTRQLLHAMATAFQIV